MAGILSYVPIVNRLIGDDSQAIDIPPVEVHNVETDPEKRARCLKHLLRANHANHAILYHNLEFHNHAPHILGSAYLLGANDKQLQDLYEIETKELEPWTESPDEVTEDDWRDFLGDKRYQRAYVDFFEDELALRCGYDWKKVVNKFLFEGKEPLVNALIGGLGHPLIHLGYAYEIDSKEVAIEALGLATTNYNFFHKYLDHKKYSKPSSFSSKSTFEIMDKLAKDKRFEGLFKEPDAENIEPLFEKHEDLVLEYWNAWNITDPVKQFEESQELAVALLVATFHVSLVRQWWLFTLVVYIVLLRPKIDPDNVDTDLKQRHWGHVEEAALNSQWAKDAHFVKAIRAMKEAARTWGDVHERYLASALTFVDNFHGWTF
uniref:Questin oxidase n=1 Tax=Colletotrichum fructicola (strain Nara gc5) TaxID=1213859 RepID=L2GG68_COLFN